MSIASHSVVPAQDSSGSDEDLQEVFRRHFETQFEPLTEQTSSVHSKSDLTITLETEEESDWEGISNDGNDVNVEVVQYRVAGGVKSAEVHKEELKEFMV